MKFKLIYLASLLAFGFTTLFSFSGGPTANAGDRTESPLSTNSCTGCHSSAGNFNPSLNLVIRDASQNLVTNGEYIPGDTYTLSFSVLAAPVGIPPTVPKFGLQAVALETATNAQAGSWSNPTTGLTGGGTGAKLTSSGGRQYLEHNTRSSDGVFNVTWTAPAAGTGSVDIYAVGLAINGSGTAGDNQVQNSFTLAESTVNNVNKLSTDLAYTLYPNPVINKQVFIKGINGEVILTLTDLTGHVLMSQMSTLQEGEAVQLPNDLTAGMYQLSILQDNKQSSQKLFVQ